ncbi:hypothetical protein RND81_06G184100 [Saponaria officinalis]|uniref:CCHC-type domain-containing protein n=1 Tax=Saponaria officinalis TaxID=3572 RepID=A0AAW1KD47_SAPOF
MPPWRNLNRRAENESSSANNVPNNDINVDQLLQMNATLVQLLSQDKSANSATSMTRAVSHQRPSQFDGKGDPVKLENWVREFEKIFTTLKCPQDLKVDQAAYYLTDQADLWWNENKVRLSVPTYQYDQNREEIETPFSWNDFKKALRQEFFPEHMRKGKRNEFNNLRQELVPTEEAKASRFEQGLDLDIQEKFGGANDTTLMEVYTRASNIERVQKLKKKMIGEKRKNSQVDYSQGSQKKGNFSNHSTRTQVFSTPTQLGGSQQTRSFSQSTSKQTYYCKKCPENHPVKDCDGNLVQCNMCGKLGHRAYECFRNQQNSENRSVSRFQGGSMVSSGSVAYPKRLQGGSNGQGWGSNTQNKGENQNNATNKQTVSASTIQGGGKSQSGKVFKITNEEARNDDHIMPGIFFFFCEM